MQSEFEQLYDDYYDCVYRYIFVSVKNKLNAEDIIATVFTKIFESKDEIREIESIKSWIFRIAHNSVIEFYSKNNKTMPTENFLDSMDDELETEDIAIRDEFKEVKKIMGQLPEDAKKILYLRFYGGLNYREISETVNVAENTVKSIIFSSIKKVKNNYEHSLI